MESGVYVLADSAERRSVLARSIFCQYYQVIFYKCINTLLRIPPGITHQRYLQAMFNEDFGRGIFDKHWQDTAIWLPVEMYNVSKLY